VGVFEELKRRNVFRVAVAYAIAAWFVAQFADVVLNNIGAPDWVIKALFLLLSIGFVAALIIAWAYELTPEGIKRERDVVRDDSITHLTGKKLNYITVAAALGVAGLVVWQQAHKEPPTAEPASVVAGTTDESDPDTTRIGARSIAILPFANRSNREGDEFFTEGIHDELLTTIAKIGSMKVISRTSVMEYRDTTMNIRDIAQELGVVNILEGGIQRSGDQVRINVQLIDAAHDKHLWAEIYDRELTAENLFAIQSEISKAIADALQATLSPEEQRKVSEVRTRNLEAYESYLLGRKLWTTRTAESNAEAVKQFQRAVDLDPTYALAYVGLSDAYRFRVDYEGVNPSEVLPLAERALNTALQLDDQLGEAYASRGALKRDALDYAGADADFLRAMELNPNHLPSYNWYALSLTAQGRIEDALAIYEKGLQLDPLSAVIRTNIGYALAGLGRFDEARRTFERSIEMHPESSFSYIGYASYQGAVLGRIDDAMLWVSKGIKVNPTNVSNMAIMAFWYLSLGDFTTAEQWLDRGAVTQENNPIRNFARLALLVNRGEMDEALVQARQNYEYRKETNSGDNFALMLLRDNDIANGRQEMALQRYATFYPEIVNADNPRIHHANYASAVEIAYLLMRSGENARGRKLLASAKPVIDATPILGLWGSAWGNARTYALLGRTEEALAELQRGVDAGWRYSWRYAFDFDPIFDSLRDEPEFVAMRAKIAADMAEQLAHVRELEASGEIMNPEMLVETVSTGLDAGI
jgi:TolB-like protein/Tfp pilus assembly protein PilF